LAAGGEHPKIETVDLRIGQPGLGAPNSAPQLAATLYLPPETNLRPIPGLLVGHGAGSNRHRHAAFCLRAAAEGLAVLAFDFRGHGESEGSVDGRLDDDVVAAAEELRRRPGVRADRIGYRGSSMGSLYGVHAARRARLAALALLCPADEAVLLEGLDGLEAENGRLNKAEELHLDVEKLRHSLESRDVRAAAADVLCPVLLLHARGDTVVPLAVGLALAQHLTGPTEVIIFPGGDHTSLQGSAAVHKRVSLWLSSTLGQDPEASYGPNSLV
jgi:pimeloyl-ACP methyl ester carboxylesterase